MVAALSRPSVVERSWLMTRSEEQQKKTAAVVGTRISCSGAHNHHHRTTRPRVGCAATADPNHPPTSRVRDAHHRAGATPRRSPRRRSSPRPADVRSTRLRRIRRTLVTLRRKMMEKYPPVLLPPVVVRCRCRRRGGRPNATTTKCAPLRRSSRPRLASSSSIHPTRATRRTTDARVLCCEEGVATLFSFLGE